MIKELIEDILIEVGYGKPQPQGSYNLEDGMPDTFITYFIPSTEVLAFYNNKPYKIGYSIDVNFYSNKMSLINTEPDRIFDLMIAAGFTAPDIGFDGGLDKDTGHYGWLMSFYYIEERSI